MDVLRSFVSESDLDALNSGLFAKEGVHIEVRVSEGIHHALAWHQLPEPCLLDVYSVVILNEAELLDLDSVHHHWHIISHLVFRVGLAVRFLDSARRSAQEHSP